MYEYFNHEIKPAWLALVRILEVIDGERYHYPIGRTSFQKIVYFATESGIPTGLTYRRSSYGPYAPKLKALITRLMNTGLIREERHGRMIVVKPGPSFKDAWRTYEHELTVWKETIEEVADLFMRMRTQQAELAATVHFAAKGDAARKAEELSELEVLDEVMRWNQMRRLPLKESDVAATIRGLGMLGWLKVKASPDLPVREEVL